MASLALFPLTQPSFLPSKPFKSNVGFPPSSPLNQRTSHATPLNCHKMYVPGNEASPEAKAAKNLHDFFNYITVKIVSAQLQAKAWFMFLQVRFAYCKRDFEWDNLKRLVFKMVDESNTKLMREYVQETGK
ncbi:chaperonin-like RBCX protein 1, chloroplastic [Gossypium australe]|uniref:Chaperonin-like RBCX protein 1, chloroplastic n=1 Tax=Gossypium australe TaxID=47621 RepID=A0A5B6WAH5_9ROSI|nr:chaperonin-like RBCX protein 1, chloroplastic [Gossypium australe]